MKLLIERLLWKIPPKTFHLLKQLLLIISIFALMFLLTEVNLLFIDDGSAQGNEFVTNWLSIKLFLARGMNPYGVEVRQTVDDYTDSILGREDAIPEKYRFLMPLYGFIVYLPFLFFDTYRQAAAWWMTALTLCSFLSAYILYTLLKKNYQVHPTFLFVTIVVVMASYPFFHAINVGAVFVVAFLFLMLAMLAIDHHADEMAGVLLAFASIAVVQMWLPILFIGVWSIRQNRGKLAGWMLGSIVLFGVTCALIMPQWLLFWGQGMFDYIQDVPIRLLPQLMAVYYPGTFHRVGLLIAVILIVILVVEWFSAKRRSFMTFFWTFSLVCVIGFLLSSWWAAEAMLIQSSAVVLVIVLWIDRWKRQGMIVAALLLILFLAFPWFISQQTGLTADQQLFWMMLPAPVFLLLNLYWVRWWLFRNTDLWFEERYLVKKIGQE